MGKLWEHARLIRSKNAGPWELTIDVICDNERDFEAIRASGIMSAESLAQAYRLEPDQVRARYTRLSIGHAPGGTGGRPPG